MSELLSGQDRTTIKDAFGVPPFNQFVSTEGLVGHTEPGGAVFAFATDLCIIELVDAGNRPVPEGAASAKVLVTNLHNRTQPLIRYELTDHFTRRPDGADPYLRATVEGRADETFRYRDVTVDPLVQTGKTRRFIPL
jgi:phenylacetate-CoA ligase